MLARRTTIVPTLITSGAQRIDAVEWPEFWTDSQRMKATTPPEIWADIRRSPDYPNRVLTNLGGYVHWKSEENAKAIFTQLHEAGVRLLVRDRRVDAAELQDRRADPRNGSDGALRHDADGGDRPSATRVNAEHTKMGRRSATITRGKLADIIVVDGNPFQSMRDLWNVAVVIKDGKVGQGLGVRRRLPARIKPADTAGTVGLFEKERSYGLSSSSRDGCGRRRPPRLIGNGSDASRQAASSAP